MRCERATLSGDAEPLVAQLRALVPSAASVAAGVAEIIAAVRARGDAGVLVYTQRFDTGGRAPRALRVSPDALARAERALAPELRSALELAITNVSRVAEAGLRCDHVVDFGEHEVILREAPVRRAAVYVPGGRAPYPSTVVMGVVTALAAGVTDVAVCAPPDSDGECNAVILGACRLTGATAVYRMGGAQAIAALAYGTESVPAVDVIVGPGNLYVQEAKRQVSGQAGIDGFAGPSDLLVLADPDAEPELIALDLLAQAEHGPGTLVIGASTSADLLDALHERLGSESDTGAVCLLIEVAEEARSLELIEAFAPEHLQLIGPRSEALAPRITRAGCLFVGVDAATAFGDYIAGSNHVLPTDGAARFASALSARSFRRSFSEVRIRNGGALARAAAPLARAEGFEFHARSMEARIRENETR